VLQNPTFLVDCCALRHIMNVRPRLATGRISALNLRQKPVLDDEIVLIKR